MKQYKPLVARLDTRSISHKQKYPASQKVDFFISTSSSEILYQTNFLFFNFLKAEAASGCVSKHAISNQSQENWKKKPQTRTTNLENTKISKRKEIRLKM